MSSDLGSDFHCTSDLDFNMSTVSGTLCVAEAIVRRWSTPRGGLALVDRDYGHDLKQYLLSPDFSKYQMANGATDEALKDERVESMTIIVDDSNLARLGSVTLTAAFVTADGPFTLTVSVSSLTVAMLRFSQAS